MTTETPTTIQVWRTAKSVLCDGFKALMAEEARILRQEGARDRCHAYVTYRDSAEFDGWAAGIATESLEEEFALLGTEAGIALGTPPGILPLTYWLHCLFLHLRTNNSKHISLYSETAGIIERLFEVSATYCTWLDRRSVEKAAMSRDGACLERNEKAAAETEGSNHERSERRSAVVMPPCCPLPRRRHIYKGHVGIQSSQSLGGGNRNVVGQELVLNLGHARRGHAQAEEAGVEAE
jgi:hypothetical protein